MKTQKILLQDVRNAINNQAVANSVIYVREGWENKLGPIIATGSCESNGYYKMNLKTGYYTLEVWKENFVTGYINIVSTPKLSSSQNVILTPVLSDNEYRVVLTWNNSPGDLDSHLNAYIPTGGSCHVYYGNKSCYYDSQLIASLDVDKTTGNGPETVTMKIKPDETGIYKYSVHDYSNKYANDSKSLSLSNAKVRVYQGSTLLASFNVPSNTIGTLWSVFKIEDGKLITINKMSNHSDPSTVI